MAHNSPLHLYLKVQTDSLSCARRTQAHATASSISRLGTITMLHALLMQSSLAAAGLAMGLVKRSIEPHFRTTASRLTTRWLELQLRYTSAPRMM